MDGIKRIKYKKLILNVHSYIFGNNLHRVTKISTDQNSHHDSMDTEWSGARAKRFSQICVVSVTGQISVFS